MPGLAITDHGNMYGVKEFFKVAKDFPEIKPIIGCEVYVTQGYDHNLKDNVNSALNSTLSRTMNTSLTTLVTMIAIAIFGGEVIRGLAVALILGIVIGTYASIFIGTPVMYDVVSAVEKRKAAKASRK